VEIYLDVTGSCRSARNTGVQRVTRGIYAELAARLPVTAICYNTVGKFYHLLGDPELEYLIAPFSRYRCPIGRPDLRGEKLPGEIRRCVRRKSFPLLPALRRGGILLVPDIFLDERAQSLPQALRKSKCRSIAIFHDAATLRLGLLSPNMAARFRAYVRSLAAFDQVICISEESRSDLLRLWWQNGIANPPETMVEPWPLALLPQEVLPGPERRPLKTILCVSSFESRKNHLLLLEAAEMLWSRGCEFELQLVGRSTGTLGRKVVPKIYWLRAKGRPLSWLKHVDDATLLRAYEQCYFTVYPSLAEGFGLPIIESLAHGKPCVCGRNGALGEIATAGGCLLIDQTNVGELASAMRQLLQNQETYNRLSLGARERRFRSWSDYGNRLITYLAGQGRTNAAAVSFPENHHHELAAAALAR
jgi:glycosyltransferase involved in cell wall biosynthesis